MIGIEKIAISQIRVINNQVQKNICTNIQNDEFISKNLLHFLKKKLRTTEQIEKFISGLSDEEKYIGELPEKWRKKFSVSQLRDKTKQIQHLFSTFADKCHCVDRVKPEKLQGRIDRLSKSLEDILGEKSKVTFVGKGDYGKVFRIQCAGEDLALKIYHSNHPRHLLFSHGATKEIANAVTLNDCLKKNQCARFYCGKVTTNSESDAFMLSEFVQKENKPTIKEKLKRWIYKKFDFGDTQKEGNLINGKITDFGAISYNFENQEQQKFAKKLYPLMVKGDSKAILDMKEKYADNENFKALTERLKKRAQIHFKSPMNFAMQVSYGRYTKEEIAASRAIGVDFGIIENYDYSKAPKELIEKIKSLGISIKCPIPD